MKQKFTIYRDRWLRGDVSYLHRPSDGQECCVGQYLRHLGVSVKALSGVRRATDIPLPEAGKWLRGTTTVSSALALRLYRANDEEDISDPIREQIITTLFAQADVVVEFADYAPE